MTLQEVLNAITEFEINFVQITLTNNKVIRGVLQNAYAGHPKDPRGYTEPYFYVFRIDLPNNPIEKYNCKEALEITQTN